MHRYYQCLRSKPFYARKYGHARCPLPAVPSEPLERIAWEEVVAMLLDPARLRAGMEVARAEHLAATGRTRARIATLDGELKQLRARLARMVEETLAVPTGSESARLLREKSGELEDVIGRLTAERAALASEPSSGLSEQDAVDLEAFAAEMRLGAEQATPQERRLIYQKLQLAGVIRRDDEHGRKLKQRNRFSMEWQNVLVFRSNAGNLVNIQSIVPNDAAGADKRADTVKAAVE